MMFIQEFVLLIEEFAETLIMAGMLAVITVGLVKAYDRVKTALSSGRDS